MGEKLLSKTYTTVNLLDMSEMFFMVVPFFALISAVI